MRTVLAVVAGLAIGPAWAVLPPASDEQRAVVAAAAAKTAWEDKVGLYKLCLAMDRIADTYRHDVKMEGKDVLPPTPTAPCTDPGPYRPPPTLSSSKPLEAAGAHSPPGPAVTPPSTTVPAADTKGKP